MNSCYKSGQIGHLPKLLALTYARLRNSRLGGRRVLRPTVLLLPLPMPPQKQGFDCFPVFAGAQFIISPATLDVDRRIEISVRAVAADATAKRLLVRPVRTVDRMTNTALLRGIGASDSGCGDASLGGIPGKLLGNVGQVGGVQVRVHGACLVFHRGN